MAGTDRVHDELGTTRGEDAVSVRFQHVHGAGGALHFEAVRGERAGREGGGEGSGGNGGLHWGSFVRAVHVGAIFVWAATPGCERSHKGPGQDATAATPRI